MDGVKTRGIQIQLYSNETFPGCDGKDRGGWGKGCYLQSLHCKDKKISPCFDSIPNEVR